MNYSGSELRNPTLRSCHPNVGDMTCTAQSAQEGQQQQV